MPLTLNLSGFAGMPAPPFRVQFPGWDDVIHWQPRTSLDAGVLAAQRQQQAINLSLSPTPAVAQDFARIGQAIDDLQDALVGLSVLGRVAVKAAGRALPGVGWVAGAADVLNTLNAFYPPNAIGVGRSLASYGKKRAMERRAGGQGGTYKQRLTATEKTGKVGFGIGELLQVLQTTDSLFGVGVSLGPVFGAASDTLFGIARGAEFEFPPLSELAFPGFGVSAAERVVEGFGAAVVPLLPLGVSTYLGLAMGAVGLDLRDIPSAEFLYEELSVSWPGLLPLWDMASGQVPGTHEALIIDIVAPLIGPVDAAIAAVFYSVGYAQGIVGLGMVGLGRALGYLGGYRDALPWQVHADMAVGQALMLGLVKPAMQASEWGLVVGGAAARLWHGGALPLVPDAASMTVGEVSAALLALGGRDPQTWLNEVPEGVEREFCQSLVSSTVDELLDAMEGPDAAVQEDSGPLWRAVIWMHEVNLLPPVGRTEPDARAYIERAAVLVPEVGERFPARVELEAVFRGIWPNVDSSWDPPPPEGV